MKRVTLILDGSADRPNAALGGKTPLEAANTPNLDALCRMATAMATVKTIPEGLEVGSAVANMGLLGFDPTQYRGRAALEAAGCGIPMNKDNLYIRMNLVRFDGASYDEAVLADYSAGELPTSLGKPIAAMLNERLFRPPYKLHFAGSFRCILEIEGGAGLYPMSLAPAHDIIGRRACDFPGGEKEAPLVELERRAFELLRNSATECNGVWFWGDSLAPSLPYGGKGRCAFSETILMRGITAAAKIPNFPTEEEHRPFEDFLKEKTQKALSALNHGYDRAYVHIQATDDLSHDRNPIGKRKAIEAIDSIVLKGLMEGLKGDFRLLVLSDHFTFSDTGSHGAEPVPCLFYDSTSPSSACRSESKIRFTEADCRRGSMKTDAPGTVSMMER